MNNIKIVILIVVVGIAITLFLGLGGQSNEVEMEKMENVENEEKKDENEELIQNTTLIDGPGYEKPEMDMPYYDGYDNSLPSNYYYLDDGANGEMSVQHNLCSKSCCSEQWPTPFKQKHDPNVCANKDEYVPSNIMCNNSYQDSGCMCLTKKQGRFLYNRGGNGREWF